MNTQIHRAVRRGFVSWMVIRSRRSSDARLSMVCVPRGVGLRVLESLLWRRVPPGPVVADLRGGVPRIGFPVTAVDGRDRAALREWLAQSGWRDGARIAPHREAAVSRTLLRVPFGPLRWVVPPGGGTAQSWPALGLLAALTDATTTPDVTRWRW